MEYVHSIVYNESDLRTMVWPRHKPTGGMLDRIKGYIARNSRFTYILIALIALIIADGLITNLLLQSGLAREGNPFLQTIVGGHKFMALKTAGAFLCAVILMDIHRHWKKLAFFSSILFVAVYTGIVIWNLSLFLLS